MAKAKSQWEFGELFPEFGARELFTVSQLTASLRKTIEGQFAAIKVTGEVTNLRQQPSGHLYFTLKDAFAQVSCVLFRAEAPTIDRTVLRDGLQVVLQGSLTVYEARGQYQLQVTHLELQGAGALQQKFEKLKEKLQLEGLFRPERKRPLPNYPARIGLVTSASGAAIRDVLQVIARRQPGLEVFLASCRVQGQGAAEEIACRLDLLNEYSSVHVKAGQPPLDLILLTRGGGSLEDLWAFNEESVARAIFTSSLPVISGVGHEIDFTIADFVADFRAATPTAAAEIITEGAFVARRDVQQLQTRLEMAAEGAMDSCTLAAQNLLHRLERAHPRRQLNSLAQRLDDFTDSLRRLPNITLREQTARLEYLQRHLQNRSPLNLLKHKREHLARLTTSLGSMLRAQLLRSREELHRLELRLNLLSPEHILARGYSITVKAADGAVVRNAQALNPGDTLLTRFSHGSAVSEVQSVNPSLANNPLQE